MTPPRLGLALLAVVGGCDGAERLTLPARPDGDVAFGALYDGDRLVELGPVASAAAIYAGEYALVGGAGLDARLYFFTTAALTAAADQVCDTEPTAVDRAQCRAATSRCAGDPSSCLAPARRVTGCGTRLAYPDSLPMVAVRRADGALRAIEGTAADLAELALCGPVVDPPCPNLRPALLITDAQGYRCVAPVAQYDCRLHVDLSACGLGAATFEVVEDGALVETAGACAVSRAAVTPALGDGPAYGWDCGGRAVVATRMDEQIAATGCPRTGPAVFETEPSFGAERVGRIAGWAAIRPEGWARRWVMTGVGLDACGLVGCRLEGENCGVECERRCDLFETRYCARAAWPACAGLDRNLQCKQRCQAFCQASAVDRPGCVGQVQGPVVSASDPAAPERVGHRVPLADDRAGPLGVQALVQLGSGEAPALLAVGLTRVHALEPGESTGELTVTATLAVGYDLGGGAAIDPAERTAAVFGRGLDGTARWSTLAVRQGRVTQTTGPNIEADLPEADLGAVSGQRLFLGSTRSPGGRRTPLVSIDLTTTTKTVLDLSGSPTALAPLPRGRALVALTEAGERGGLGLVWPDGDISEVDTLNGLVPKALAVDPSRCTPDRCLVWVAYEPRTRSSAAVVGQAVVEGDQLTLRAALVPAPMDRVGLLGIDPFGDAVVALDPSRNQLVTLPITLPTPEP